ncbi:MAG: hypothetical protein LIP03_11770 [Bacteroidales bacterium]|nr:hypothetical protein [Bacteroidales bacterium]
MKTLIISIALAVAAITAMAQEKSDSTTHVFTSAEKVTVVEGDKGVTITVWGADSTCTTYTQPYSADRVVKKQRRSSGSTWIDRHLGIEENKEGDKYILAKKGQSNWDAIIGGIGLGFNLALDAPDQMDTQMGRSWDISWLYMLGAEYTLPGTRNKLTFGLGLDWRNYKMQGLTCFQIEADGTVGFGTYPEGVIPKFSRLKIFSLTIPVLYRQHIPLRFPHNRWMSIAFGPQLNFNTHASMKTAWTDAQGNEVTQTSNSVHQRRVTVDALGIVFLNSWLGVYVRYAPMKQFKGNAPQFSSLTTGLTIGF